MDSPIITEAGEVVRAKLLADLHAATTRHVEAFRAVCAGLEAERGATTSFTRAWAHQMIRATLWESRAAMEDRQRCLRLLYGRPPVAVLDDAACDG